MNVHRPLRPSASAALRRVTDPEGLSAILRPDCAAVLWERPPQAGLHAWLEGLDPEDLPRARLVTPVPALEDVVATLLGDTPLPKGPEKDALQGDIVHLAQSFADAMGAAYLRLRLDVVTTNACRKFHLDALTARLVCTYRGTGTQYGVSEDGADPSEIHTVPTGVPILLRGTLWPVEPPAGLLHRSPPIEGTGETRLVLVLDPVTDPDLEA